MACSLIGVFYFGLRLIFGGRYVKSNNNVTRSLNTNVTNNNFLASTTALA